MIYFDVKDDIAHMTELLATFERIVKIEADCRKALKKKGATYLGPYQMFREIREYATDHVATYAAQRENFAKMIPRADTICASAGIFSRRQDTAAPMEGSRPFDASVFDLVLDRPSDLMDIDNDVRDTVNKTLGALQNTMARERRQLLNPLYWLGKAFLFIIRLPYTLLALSGFDVAKIQEHLIAKLFQLLYVIALILILVRYGLLGAVDLASLLRP